MKHALVADPFESVAPAVEEGKPLAAPAFEPREQTFGPPELSGLRVRHPRVVEVPAGEDELRGADRVFAASTATDRLADAGVPVDAMVTDLDKNPETGAERTERGEPVVVHAHGDNRDSIDEWLPRYDARHVLATTQAAPRTPVANPGGFTDGDRAAFLADALGAAELVFVGWDFDDPGVSDGKARKLRWAERLLAWLERRRGERFALLDGRRDRIDPVADADRG